MVELVSIITPSYNSTRFIKETIESVKNQTYENWEMLIVDDCSPDNSAEFITKLIENDPRIKLIKLDKNIGAAEARNVALQEAKGKYIAFLDSDDTWLPHKLSTQINFMQNKNLAFTFSSYSVISEDGKEHGVITAPQKITYSEYLKNTIIGCLTVVIDKEKTGPFKMPNKKSSHDMGLWLDLLKRNTDAYGLPEVLAKYRLVSTSNTANKWKAAKGVWSIYRDVEHLSLFKSCYYWSFYVYNAIKKRLSSNSL